MSLRTDVRGQLILPVICAPMFLVSTPELVLEACRAGVMGALPRQNVRTFEQFDAWLTIISEGLAKTKAETPGQRLGPLAVNLATRMPPDELAQHLELCRRHGVTTIISAAGDPTELVARVHDFGGVVFHDVTSLRFAEKAIRAGADGLTCIGSGGGGHSGTLSHLALIPQIRSMFDGLIIMAGAVSTGAAVRAAEVLGADLAYMGTRFIATQESGASSAYKDLLVQQGSSDLMFTDKISGVAANWLKGSMAYVGLDPAALPEPLGKMRHDHLPQGATPWKTIWSAGQGIDLIDDIPSVAELVRRLRLEYVTACEAESLVNAARLS